MDALEFHKVLSTINLAQTTRADATSELLERFEQLSALAEHLAAVREGSQGRLVLVGGEAGVGKTVLVRRFCEEQGPSLRVLWGTCDPLFTPRPLGPVLDVAEAAGGELADLVERGATPYELASRLMRELGTRSPTALILEDLHWADEATLDVFRLLGRRIESIPALVLATYRDDELDRADPLRIVLGELATGEAIDRLKLAPLSAPAVAKLAEPSGVDAEELYRKTLGNPFFVTEILAAGEDEIPPTIRDAVLARAARLTPAARALLEAVAIVPPQAELWLLEMLETEALDHLEECLRSGMLTSKSGGVAFRHELARLAVEESLPPNRSLVLHRKALAALAAPPAGSPDLVRLTHHAEGANDADAVLRFAPAAGARAASLGAHREAAAHYARTLRFADRLPTEARAELLERHSHECYLTDQSDEAIEALKRALRCYRELGDRRKEGDSLRGLSDILWCPGRTAEAEQAGREAVAVLERLPPGRELAMAYSNLAALRMNAEDAEETVAWGTRAIELAQRLDDVEIMVHTLNTIGTMALLRGAPEGRRKLERSLELAEQAGLQEHRGRAFLNLAKANLRSRSYALTDPVLDAGLAYCTEHGLDLFRLYLLAYRARSELARGCWAEAVESAELVLGEPRTSTLPRTLALVVLALVRARRGDPGYWPLLDEAHALAEGTGEPQRIVPVAAARAEAFWLESEHDAVADATGTALELALRRQDPWLSGELAYWRRRAGIEEEPPPEAAEPYALELAGDWEQAAEVWTEIGCPYEAALALADGDEAALRRGHAELQRLGAVPASSLVAQRLRERGVRGVPRGPRPSTQNNPANLTEREVEVLALVAEGLANAQIAERLFISAKTVDHHVSAILRKLSVRTRGQAGAEAVRLGLAGQDR